MRKPVPTLLTVVLAAGALLASAYGLGASRQTATVARATAGQSPAEVARFVFPAATEVNGIRMSELSGLAWDADEKLLYAVSDPGYVFHFRLLREGGWVVALQPVHAALLVDSPRGRPVHQRINAEGFAVDNASNTVAGDTELIVAVEGDPPRIMRFSPAGMALDQLTVPPPADDLRNYRKKGRGLESVVLHPLHGLMTAPESPLRGQAQERHTLFASDGQWSFERRGTDSRLKGFDVLPGGDLVTLERNRTGVKNALTASLRRVRLTECGTGDICGAETLAVMPAGPDNFEGMTMIDAQHLMLVSDNGGSRSLDTVFLLLDVTEKKTEP